MNTFKTNTPRAIDTEPRRDRKGESLTSDASAMAAIRRALAGDDPNATVVIPATNLPAMYGVGPDYTAPAPVYSPLESSGNRLAGAAMNGDGEGV